MASLTPMPAGETRELRRNWHREARMADIYRRLAGVAREPRLSRHLGVLAAAEQRHADAWEGLLRRAGWDPAAPGAPPAAGRRPWLSGMALALLARLFGLRPVLALAMAAEGHLVRTYLGQVRELTDEGAQDLLRRLLPEELAHADEGVHRQGAAELDPGEQGSGAEGWQVGGLESIRNVIYGVNDGLTATLGVLAGVGGATVDPRVVLVGGLAAMTASAVSMAGGSYLATKSQREIYEDRLAREAAEIEAMPELERAELRAIYRSKGLTDAEAAAITERITADKRVWLETKAREELGFDPGQLENPRREGLVAGVATLVGGGIPVLGYLAARVLAGSAQLEALAMTFLVCLCFLWAMGAARSLFTGKGTLRSGFEMAGVGTVVATVTYVLGAAFKSA